MAVVCGTDFSAQATTAARAAAAVAARFGEPLRLVHVREPRAGRQILEGQSAEAERALAEELREDVERLGAAGATVEGEVRAGLPDEELADLAGRLEATLLVVGALGRRSAARWHLGSVVERTVLSSHVPVLVVRDAAPFEAWARGERPLRVVVCADFGAGTDAAVAWVRKLRAVGPCELTVMHVYAPAAVRHRLGLAGGAGVDSDPDAERILERELAERLGPVAGDGVPRLVVTTSPGSPVGLLLEQAAGADLIVVGTRQRRWLDWLWHGSFSREVLHRAAANVACIPAFAAAWPMPAFDRVVAATDGSEGGDGAVAWAYASTMPGGTVHLVTVLEPGRRNAGDRADVAARLRALEPADAASRRVSTTIELAESDDVPAAVCQAADRLGAHVVCVGTRGRTGLARLMPGSVARAVVARSSRPVLVVPCRR